MKYILPCLLSILTAVSAVAQATYQWNGTTNSNWQTSTNWQASPGQPTHNVTLADSRLNVLNGANSTLNYTSAEGTTTFAGAAVRGLVIGAGSMQITGGTFATTAMTGDIIGNAATGSLVVNGGNYTASAAVTVGFGTTGNGTLTLTSGTVTMIGGLQMGNAATTTSTVNLDGGDLSVLNVNSAAAGGSKTFNFNGGTLKATSGVDQTFFGNVTTVNVKAGGAKIDTNVKNVTINQALLNGGGTDGGLTKSGTQTLTLGGVNTYTGNTTVSTGTLVLADNAELRFKIGGNGTNSQVNGSGAITINGDFRFDLTTAGTTFGNSWNVITVGSTAETFGVSFLAKSTLGDFNNSGGIWSINENGTTYEFSQASGLLTVVPEPATWALLAFSLTTVMVLRRRRSIS